MVTFGQMALLLAAAFLSVLLPALWAKRMKIRLASGFFWGAFVLALIAIKVVSPLLLPFGFAAQAACMCLILALFGFVAGATAP